jgi:large subunit ribosomal protein L21
VGRSDVRAAVASSERTCRYQQGCAFKTHSKKHPRSRELFDRSGFAMYAIVKTGGKQYRVAVGDVVTVEKLDLAPGASVALPAILLVDGEDVTTDATALAAVSVTAEIVGMVKGPKIKIHKFKNKTGYHKRIGHRQKLSQVRVTGIESGKK